MNGFGRLRRVIVRQPRPEDLAAWRDYGWHREPDPAEASAEHDAFRDLLEAAGADVVVATAPTPGDPDAIYAYDPTLITDAGVIALRPGKPGRRAEPEAFVVDLGAAGVSSLGAIRPPGIAEGGDMFFLDDRTLLVGLGYRTNEAGVAQLRELLDPLGIEVHTFDLPHLRGPAECLHLMSFISPLDADLAVAFPPLMPVRLLDLLRERGVELVEVPEEEFPTMGPNVLALGPRLALALDGNPETRRRLEAHGVEVRVYQGEEISRNGDGGPTCLTRPITRG
ncbi:MAG TPA: arginine deiminase family protein [Actinomycetota bacterium]|nr:arginine deiminase family protein [Actinomycetota bacterium]